MCKNSTEFSVTVPGAGGWALRFFPTGTILHFSVHTHHQAFPYHSAPLYSSTPQLYQKVFPMTSILKLTYSTYPGELFLFLPQAPHFSTGHPTALYFSNNSSKVQIFLFKPLILVLSNFFHSKSSTSNSITHPIPLSSQPSQDFKYHLPNSDFTQDP